MNNEQRKHFDPIGSAILEALASFVEERDPRAKIVAEMRAAKHPAGAIAVIVDKPGVQGVIELGSGERFPHGTYLFPGAPTVANSDQANAAVQAMGNLGYRWSVDNHSWTKPIAGLDGDSDGHGSPHRQAAIRTLVELGYTYNGLRTWDAPQAAQQANNLFPGQQSSQADAGVVAAAQGMARELEPPHLHRIMDGLWSQDQHWTVLASTIGLEPEDRSPVAVMAARTYMAAYILAQGD